MNNIKDLIGTVVLAYGTCGQAKGLLISGVLKSVNELNSKAIVYTTSMGNAEVDTKTIIGTVLEEDCFYRIKVKSAHDNETTNYYVNHNFRGVEIVAFYNNEGHVVSSQYIQDVYNVRNIEGLQNETTDFVKISKEDFQLILELYKN